MRDGNQSRGICRQLQAERRRGKTGGGDPETLADVRAKVQQACDLLRAPSPEAVEGCVALMATAASGLEQWRAGFQKGDAASNRLALAEARRVRVTVLRAGALLESAAAFHAGWRKTLGALCAGYTSSGAAADAALPGRLCLRG